MQNALTIPRNPVRRRSIPVLSWWATALLALILGAGLVLVGPANVAGATQAGDVSLVSHTLGGAGTTNSLESADPSVSADGAYVAFVSWATHMVSNQTDANNEPDVFLLERATGKVTLVSHVSSNPAATGNGMSYRPAISADGAYVAFTSAATNLIVGTDQNAISDVFLFERATGKVTLVSHEANGATKTAAGPSDQPSISDDGAFVAFASSAPNLALGQVDNNGGPDVFLFSRATGSLTLVSHTWATPGTAPNAVCMNGPAPCPPSEHEILSISDDGAFVAFQAWGTNLVSGQVDTNNGPDIFLFTRSTLAVTLVSHTPASTTTTGDGLSRLPRTNGDGSVVAFESRATNLVVGQSDTNNSSDVFIAAGAGEITLVSHKAANPKATGNVGSYEGSPSADGAFTAFESHATDLISGQVDGDATVDAFLFSKANGSVKLISRTASNPAAAAGGVGGYSELAVSADGAFVAFESNSTNLVAGQSDTNDTQDLFLFERSSGTVKLVSHTPAGAAKTGDGRSIIPSISADGTYVAFESAATNLGQADNNVGSDVFLFQRTATPPEIAVGDVQVTEGDAGSTAYFPVTLSHPSPAPVTVEYTTDNGSAVQPSDYTLKAGTLSIPAGAVAASVPVIVKGDGDHETHQTFTVKLSSPGGATIADGHGIGLILDDDPTSGLRLNIGNVSMNEGDAGNRAARLTVGLSSPSAATVTVDFTTVDASATQPVDYLTKSEVVTFSPGTTSKVVDVTVKADKYAETQQQFMVNLSNPTGGAAIADGSGVVTIRNDD